MASGARWLVGGASSLLGTLLVAELLVRVGNPTPRLQVVRGGATPAPDIHQITLLHGEPVWEEPGSEARRNLGCRGAQTRDVLLLGSSILFGTGYEADQVVSHHLQRRLDAAEPGVWCVLNYAQPGFTSRSKLALARELLPTLQPEIVVWEQWVNDPGGFTMLGSDAYNLTRLVTDDEGFPVWGPLPAALHHRLFRASRLWEYSTLSLAPEWPKASERVWDEVVERTLPELQQLAEAHGVAWSIVYAPPLDRPFVQSAERSHPNLKGYVRVAAWAEQAGVVELDLATVFGELTPEAVRHDPCCHYNPTGHARVAEALERLVRAQWAERAQASPERGSEP
jgi:hypothetical protein